jgi:hypothetical protein
MTGLPVTGFPIATRPGARPATNGARRSAAGPARRPPRRPPAAPTRLPAGEVLEGPLATACLVFVAALTLEWIAISGFAGGFVKPFHVGVLLVIGLCLLKWRPERFVVPAFRRHAGVYGAAYGYLLVVFALGFMHTTPYFSRTEAVRQFSYIGASVFIAALFAWLPGRRAQRRLVWAGGVTIAVLIVGLVTALTAQGVNAVALLSEALAKGDPDIVSGKLLQTAFRSSEDFAEAGANLRHKVFAAVLVATFLTLAFRAVVEGRRGARAAVVAIGLTGSLLVLVSLSRSTTVTLVGALALVGARAVVRQRARPASAFVLFAGVAVLVIVAVSPLGTLVVNRFNETKSYDSRSEAASSVLSSDLGASVLIGTDATEVEHPPHNLVLDAWLSGGILASAAVVALLLALLKVWGREAIRYVTGRGGWVLPVDPLWVLGIGLLPFVRAFSAGNGFSMIEWAAVGMFLGIVAANDAAVRSGRSAEPARPSPARR